MAFKPDFLVYNLSGSVRCVILIAEFKPTERNSYIESDFIKLAKTDEGDFEQVDYQWSCEA